MQKFIALAFLALMFATGTVGVFTLNPAPVAPCMSPNC
jgi:hypothetical protein